eukprot:6116645-Amphidinium_carterae.1
MRRVMVTMTDILPVVVVSSRKRFFFDGTCGSRLIFSTWSSSHSSTPRVLRTPLDGKYQSLQTESFYLALVGTDLTSKDYHSNN